jgi:putative sigma-54 modulation protein
MNENNTTTLPIHITPHHLRLSLAISEFVYDKFAKVPRFASDVLATDVVLRRHHGSSEGPRFSASARLALAGHDIHASATHADLYTAIVKLVATLARRSRKRKTRLMKAHAMRPRALRYASESSADSPVLDDAAPNLTNPEARSPRWRSGGQEQRSSGFRRTARFPLHQM